jgi:hypothetical protein
MLFIGDTALSTIEFDSAVPFIVAPAAGVAVTKDRQGQAWISSIRPDIH